MNKIVKNIIIIVVVIIALIIGYFLYNYMQESNFAKLEVYNYEEDSNYTKYTGMEGIEFSYPSNYESIGTETQPTFTDPEILGASVNLISEDSQDLSLENYLRISKESVKKSITLKSDIIEEYINLNGVKAAKIEYTAEQENNDIKIEQAIIIKSGKAYILTVGCLPSDSEAMQEKTEKIIKSFR